MGKVVHERQILFLKTTDVPSGDKFTSHLSIDRMISHRVNWPKVALHSSYFFLINGVKESTFKFPLVDVVVTLMASWSPPRTTSSCVGDMEAEFTGLSVLKVFLQIRVKALNNLAIVSLLAVMKNVLSVEN